MQLTRLYAAWAVAEWAVEIDEERAHHGEDADVGAGGEEVKGQRDGEVLRVEVVGLGLVK